MNIEEFKNLVKVNRADIIKPYDLIFKEFTNLDIAKKSQLDIQTNVSDLIDKLRTNSWNEYKPIEQEFTVRMLKALVELDASDDINNLVGIDAVTKFIEIYPEYIYQLTLSNTNSRRSRAGKEFEAILELLLMACNISLDSQGSIGKKELKEKGLGKMVDIVTPSATHFEINRYDTVLISAKTTLRERWQEVSEETNRTSATSMYLATLEDKITSEVISSLDEAGVRLVVPKSFKESTYKNFASVISYETLFSKIIENESKWSTYQFASDDIKSINDSFEKQSSKHKDNYFIKNYFKNQIDKN